MAASVLTSQRAGIVAFKHTVSPLAVRHVYTALVAASIVVHVITQIQVTFKVKETLHEKLLCQ